MTIENTDEQRERPPIEDGYDFAADMSEFRVEVAELKRALALAGYSVVTVVAS